MPDFSVGSELFVRVATGIALVSFTTAALMLAAMALVQRRQAERRARRARVLEQWQPVLARSIDEEVPLPPLPARDLETVVRAWVRTQEALRGKARENLNRLGHRLALLSLGRTWIDRREPRLRMLALALLGLLGDRTSAPKVRALMHDRRSWLALAAAQACLRIEGGQALPAVLTLAALRTDWAVSRVVETLREWVGSELGDAIALTLRREALRPQGRARLLRIAAVAPLPAVDAAASAVLRDADDPEVAMAALALVHSPQSVGLARRRCHDPHWMVRMEATRALGRIGDASDVPQLVRALADPNWWVRYRSAQALVRAPWLTPQQLQDLVAGLGDRFAADMLRHTRSELR